jgi:hypothetical protein
VAENGQTKQPKRFDSALVPSKSNLQLKQWQCWYQISVVFYRKSAKPITNNNNISPGFEVNDDSVASANEPHQRYTDLVIGLDTRYEAFDRKNRKKTLVGDKTAQNAEPQNYGKTPVRAAICHVCNITAQVLSLPHAGPRCLPLECCKRPHKLWSKRRRSSKHGNYCLYAAYANSCCTEPIY